MPAEDYSITSRDLRVGMGIGGWNMEWTVMHLRTGVSLTYQTHGHRPQQHRIRPDIVALLDMLVEAHFDA